MVKSPDFTATCHTLQAPPVLSSPFWPQAVGSVLAADLRQWMGYGQVMVPSESANLFCSDLLENI